MASKKQTKTKSKNLRHRKGFKILVAVFAVIILLVVGVTILSWAWNANYHKDDLRNRPINSNFVYLGRDFRGRNVSWFYNVSGLRGFLGPSTETLFYATNISPDDFVANVPGSLHLKNKTTMGCIASVHDKNCIDLDIRNDQGRGGFVTYTSRQALLNASKKVGFPLKSDERKYYVGITASVMQYISPANVDPEVYKTLLGGSR